MRADIVSAVQYIRENYAEPLTLDELAASVYISPFHFCRVFAAEIGMSPGRFISAVRFYEAKKLLCETSMPIADAVCTVGYSSVGTFTTRFMREVGLKPSEFRNPDLRKNVLAVCHVSGTLPVGCLAASDEVAAPTAPRGEKVTLRVECPVRVECLIAGFFKSPIPQRAPELSATCVVGDNVLASVPTGQWNTITVGRTIPTAQRDAMMVVAHGRVNTVPDKTTIARMRLRPLRVTDAPFLVALDPSRHVGSAAPAATALEVAA